MWSNYAGSGDAIYFVRVGTLDDFAALLHRLPKTGQVRIGVVRDDQVDFGIMEFKGDATP